MMITLLSPCLRGCARLYFAAACTLAGVVSEAAAQHVAPKARSADAVATACRPASDALRGPSDQLDAAWTALGADRLNGRILTWTVVDVTRQAYQSDRPYPPYFSMATTRHLAFDPTSGTERSQYRIEGLGVPSGRPHITSASTASAGYLLRDTLVTPFAGIFDQNVVTRPLNAWSVLGDWRRDTSVAVTGRCLSRDYWRLALRRQGVYGPEQLLLDEKTHLPVMLSREEPHYLWGQVLAEYVYQTWVFEAGVMHPGAVSRLVDGETDVERIETSFQVASRDSAATPAIPALPATPPMHPGTPGFLLPLPLDTVRLAHDVFLLKNPGYREGMVYARDTVFILDATQGEARSRADSAWVSRLFPRHRAVVVVVTDLAWPHIAGVRFWVARGATIVSRHTSRAILQRVVARRWTRTPDALEQQRSRGPVPFRFRGVADSLPLAGGAVTLYAIDGIGSEGALMAFMPRSGVLWAGDYIQQLRTPALYTAEVARAVQRNKLAPRVVAAEHLDPVSWTRVQPGTVGVP